MLRVNQKPLNLMSKRASDSISQAIPLFLIFMGVLIAFQRMAIFFFPDAPFHLADEVLLVLTMISIFYCAIKTNLLPVDQAALLLVTLILILLSILFGLQKNIFYVMGQCVISFKFFYFLTVLLNSPRQQLMLAMVKRMLLVITAIALIGMAINIVYPPLFTDYFGGKAVIRGGELERIQSFFLNSNYLGFTIAISFAYAAFFLLKTSTARLGLIAIAIILVFMTGSRSALMIAFFSLFFLIAHSEKRSQQLSIMMLAIMFIGTSALVFYSGLYQSLLDIYDITMKDILALSIIDESRYIRAVVFYYGFELMLTHFPFGTGAATYASQLSADSPVYETLNIRAIDFFEEMSSAIFDSNWGTVMGEYGLIGIMIYGFLLRKVYVKMRDRLSDCRISIGYLRFIMLSIVLSAFTAPVFTQGYLTLLFASALFMGLDSNIKPNVTAHKAY